MQFTFLTVVHQYITYWVFGGVKVKESCLGVCFMTRFIHYKSSANCSGINIPVKNWFKSIWREKYEIKMRKTAFYYCQDLKMLISLYGYRGTMVYALLQSLQKLLWAARA